MVLWRYLFFQYFKTVVNILVFLLLFYFTLTYMEESKLYFSGRNAHGKDIFYYYFWQIPTIAIQFLPFCVLVGCIITNWILAKHGEIAALRAAGMSLFRISIPLIFLGLFFSLCHFGINEIIIPYSTEKFLDTKFNKIEKKQLSNIFKISNWLRTKSSILHFEEYIEAEQFLKNPELFLYDNSKNIVKIIHAKKAYFNPDIQRWIFQNALISNFNAHALLRNTEVTKSYQTDIDFAPPQMLNQQSDSSLLSYWKLKKIIDDAQIAGTNNNNRLVDLYFKISNPVANLLFVFLSIPFALKKERQEDNYFAVIICVIVALINWFGNLALKNLANIGSIHPLFAAWCMNIIIGCLSIILIRKLDKG